MKKLVLMSALVFGISFSAWAMGDKPRSNTETNITMGTNTATGIAMATGNSPASETGTVGTGISRGVSGTTDTTTTTESSAATTASDIPAAAQNSY